MSWKLPLDVGVKKKCSPKQWYSEAVYNTFLQVNQPIAWTGKWRYRFFLHNKVLTFFNLEKATNFSLRTGNECYPSIQLRVNYTVSK